MAVVLPALPPRPALTRDCCALASVGRVPEVDDQPQPGRDWFRVFAFVALGVAVAAMLGGLFLMAAAFLWVGA